jgi:hypothetical protein
VLPTPVCVATNRYFVPSQSLPADADDQRIEVRCDNDVPLSAFSFGIAYDKSVLSVTGVSTAGTVAETAFVTATIDSVAGTVGCAAVLLLDPGSVFVDRAVPAGQNRVVAILAVDVLVTADSATTISFADVNLNPSVPALRVNVMTDNAGSSISPGLVAGDITIEDRTPRILALQRNTGLSGDVFQVTGEFFDEPGLAVRVCGSSAPAILRSDAITLDVTAPACARIGPVGLEVCTDRGCVAVANGFDYEAPPIPAIAALSGNRGQEGTHFTVVGSNFDGADLVVSVCGLEADIVLVNEAGTSIIAGAPNCGALGPAEVRVCTAHGCASEPNGFFYEFAGPRFTRGDCNADGAVDGTSDAVFMIAFLFQQGQEWPCFAACDFNDDLSFDVSDAIFLLSAGFAGGPPPPPPATCGPGSEGSLLVGCETPQCD